MTAKTALGWVLRSPDEMGQLLARVEESEPQLCASLATRLRKLPPECVQARRFLSSKRKKPKAPSLVPLFREGGERGGGEGGPPAYGWWMAARFACPYPGSRIEGGSHHPRSWGRISCSRCCSRARSTVRSSNRTRSRGGGTAS